MRLTSRARAKRATARGIDAILDVVAGMWPRDTAPVVIPRAPRVLVIRCDHIGDAVMATPVLRPLREALQPSRLDVLAGPWAASLFEQHPAVDQVLTYATPWWSAARGVSMGERLSAWTTLPAVVRRIRAGRYDVGIDLRGDLRQIALFLRLSGIPVRASSDRTGGRRLLTHAWTHDASRHEVENNFAIAALLGARGTPRLDVSVRADEADSLADDLVPGGYAVFALRGSEENREWPAEHAGAVVDALWQECGLATVCIGAAAEATIGEAVAWHAQMPVLNLAGRTSLAQASALLARAAVAVAVDSGPMHLAAAAGTPVVALFGSGDPRECGPWSDRAEIVSASAPCGCQHSRCDFARGPGRCMRAISPAMVVEAVHRAISRATSTERSSPRRMRDAAAPSPPAL